MFEHVISSTESKSWDFKKKSWKNYKKKIINWTYPQIRLDGKFAKNFAAPLHVDKWILHPKKKGYTIWFPLNKNGGSLLISNKKKINKIISDKYWNLKGLDENLNFKKININFGQALLFDQSLIHKSLSQQNRISVQFRYEVLTKNFNKRTVNQVVDPEVLKFWRKQLL